MARKLAFHGNLMARKRRRKSRCSSYCTDEGLLACDEVDLSMHTKRGAECEVWYKAACAIFPGLKGEKNYKRRC
eukprot:7057001-Ditylum_brightwellii.AAC.1